LFGEGTGRGVWGVGGPSGVSTPKNIRAFQKLDASSDTCLKKQPPAA